MDLLDMTLTVVDGDFQREVLPRQPGIRQLHHAGPTRTRPSPTMH